MIERRSRVGGAIYGKVKEDTCAQIITYRATRKQWRLWKETQDAIIRGEVDARFSIARNSIIDNLGV